MIAEIRADGMHISGYINVPGRMSRPVNTPRGKVIEVIEPGAFARAIAKTKKIDMLLDHDENRTLANTSNNSMILKEDSIGLHVDSVVTDPEVIKGAKEGRLKGWSFKMRNVVDSVEERAGQLPIRTIKDFTMPEVTLAMNKVPVYSATSIECRAEDDDGEETEFRAADAEIEVVVEKNFDNSEFRARAEALEIKEDN